MPWLPECQHTRIEGADEGSFDVAVDVLHSIAVQVLEGLREEGRVADAVPLRPRFHQHVFRRRSRVRSGVNFMRQKWRVKFLLVEFVLALINSFLHFWAPYMFALKFWGNNYSEVEQNLLPGRNKGESYNYSYEKFIQEEFYSKLLTIDHEIDHSSKFHETKLRVKLSTPWEEITLNFRNTGKISIKA